jgi:hypothetical protein
MVLFGMDAETTRHLFTYASAGFELAGLALVVKEIWDARQHARAVLGGKSGADLRLRVGRELAVPYAIESDVEPTTWERLQDLEQIQMDQARDLSKAIGNLSAEVRAEIDQVRNEALKAAASRDSALRDLIAIQEGGSIGWRAVGAVLIAIGIVLAVPANLVG